MKIALELDTIIRELNIPIAAFESWKTAALEDTCRRNNRPSPAKEEDECQIGHLTADKLHT